MKQEDLREQRTFNQRMASKKMLRALGEKIGHMSIV
jgi:hypothetical protein